LLYNDGSPIPERLLAETLAELRARFGAASWETRTVQGHWEHEGAIYRDNLTKLFVDVPDLPDHRAFFQRLQGKIEAAFQSIGRLDHIASGGCDLNYGSCAT
jgi:hypothetical protein